MPDIPNISESSQYLDQASSMVSGSNVTSAMDSLQKSMPNDTFYGQYVNSGIGNMGNSNGWGNSWAPPDSQLDTSKSPSITSTGLGGGSGGSGKRNWPKTSPDSIMGLPPVAAHNDEYLLSIFKKSFPILTIKAVSLIPKEKQGRVQKTTMPGAPSDGYKFALLNEGGVSCSFSNEYGASDIEQYFTRLAESNTMRELHQIMQTSNVLGPATKNTYAALKSASEDFIKQVTNSLNSKVPSMGAFGSEVVQPLIQVGRAVVDATVMGCKIDIPNVWQGSTGSISPSITIDLRTIAVDDEHYNKYIIEPITALLCLALPLRKSDNEILTYENPPYIEASIDNYYHTRLGGIKNLTLDWDYKDVATYESRIRHVRVKMDIVDLYETFVWAEDESNYSEPLPTSKFLINTLKKTTGKTKEGLDWIATSLYMQHKTSSGIVSGNGWGNSWAPPDSQLGMDNGFGNSWVIPDSQLPFSIPTSFPNGTMPSWNGGFSEIMKNIPTGSFNFASGLGNFNMPIDIPGGLTGLIGMNNLPLQNMEFFDYSSILGQAGSMIGNIGGMNLSGITSGLSGLSSDLTSMLPSSLPFDSLTSMIPGSSGLGSVGSVLNSQIGSIDMNSLTSGLNAQLPTLPSISNFGGFF